MSYNNVTDGSNAIGNGEVDSSILSGSTSFTKHFQLLAEQALHSPPRAMREREANLRPKLGENAGTLFTRCSIKGVAHVRTA